MIEKESKELKQGMKNIDDAKNIQQEEDTFVLVMNSTHAHSNVEIKTEFQQFVNEAHHSFHELLTQFSQMQCDFQHLVNFFAEEYTISASEDFFGSFAIFLQHLESTKEAILKSQQSKDNIVARHRHSITGSSGKERLYLRNGGRRASLPASTIKYTVKSNNPSITGEFSNLRQDRPIRKVSEVTIIERVIVADEILPDSEHNDSEDNLQTAAFCIASDSISEAKIIAHQQNSPEPSVKHSGFECTSLIPHKLSKSQISQDNIPMDKNVILNEKSAHEAAIRSSRSPVLSPKRLNNVKAKLEEEKMKSLQAKSRKVTQHEQPLYYLVMKETIEEYEKQKDLNTLSPSNSPSSSRKNAKSPNFLGIMQQKLCENVPDITNDYGDVKLSHGKRASITEPVFANVIRKALIEYENEKREHSQRKLGIQHSSNGRHTPNLMTLLERKLSEENLIVGCDVESNNETDGELDETEDPLYALVIKAALKEHRHSLSCCNTTLPHIRHIGELETLEELPSLDEISAQNDHGRNLKKDTPNHSRYTPNHSRSSSEISLASQEVNEINQKCFISASRTQYELQNSRSNNDFLTSGSKPALPVIPSPDYTVQEKPYLEKDMQNLQTKTIDSSTKVCDEKADNEHPHHIPRLFWNSAANHPQSAFVNSTEQAIEIKKPTRKISMKRKVSNSSLMNDVIDEVAELEELTIKSGIIDDKEKEIDVDKSIDTNLNNLRKTSTDSNESTLMLSFDLVTTTSPDGIVSTEIGTVDVVHTVDEVPIRAPRSAICEPASFAPTVNRSKKPIQNLKVATNYTNNTEGVENKKVNLLKSIIPSPDYSPISSPELKRVNMVPDSSLFRELQKSFVTDNISNPLEIKVEDNTQPRISTYSDIQKCNDERRSPYDIQQQDSINSGKRWEEQAASHQFDATRDYYELLPSPNQPNKVELVEKQVIQFITECEEDVISTLTNESNRNDSPCFVHSMNISLPPHERTNIDTITPPPLDRSKKPLIRKNKQL